MFLASGLYWLGLGLGGGWSGDEENTAAFHILVPASNFLRVWPWWPAALWSRLSEGPQCTHRPSRRSTHTAHGCKQAGHAAHQCQPQNGWGFVCSYEGQRSQEAEVMCKGQRKLVAKGRLHKRPQKAPQRNPGKSCGNWELLSPLAG